MKKNFFRTQMTRIKQIFTEKLSVFILLICVILFVTLSVSEGRVLFPFPLFAQQNKTDSLLTLIKTDKQDTNKINHLNALGVELMYINPDTAILLGKQALEIAGHLSSLITEGKGKGLILKFVANSLGQLGIYFYLKADYPKALEAYLKALKINEDMLNSAKNISEKQIAQKGVAARLSNIGSVYRDQADYSAALGYFLKGLKIAEELGNKQFQANNLGNIGILYHEQTNYPGALDYYLKALKINEELGRKSEISIILGNIGTLYGDQSDYPNALDYFLKALKINEELGSKYFLATNLGNIGSVYIKTGKYAEAEEYLKNSICMSDSIGALNNIRQTEEMLTNLYLQTNRYQLALEHYKKSRIVKDSIFNEEKSKDIGKLEARHEFEFAEVKRNQEEEEKTRQLAVLVSRRNKLQYSGIFIFLVFLIITLLLLVKKNISIKVVEGVIFLSFLLFFEFLLVLLDPFMDKFSNGEPLYKLIFNAGVALLIFPAHKIFEGWVKGRLLKNPSIHDEKNINEKKDKGKTFFNMFSVSFSCLVLVVLNSSFQTKQSLDILSKADSLKNQLKILTQKPETFSRDTTCINTLNTLAWHLRIENSEEAIHYIKKGFSLAKKINFKKGKANLHHTCASLYYNKGDYDKALQHGKTALNLRRLIGDKAGIATSYNNIGNINKDKGNFPVALNNYESVLKIYEELKDKKNISYSYSNIGIIYWSQGNYPKALRYYFMALKNFEEQNDQQGIATTHNNIGGIYWSQENINDALKHFVITLKIYDEMGQRNGKFYSNTLSNIGLIYWNQNNYSEALNKFLLSLRIYEETGDKNGIANTYNNLGLIHRDQDNLSEAMKNFMHALEIREQIGDKPGAANSCCNIGSVLTLEFNNLSGSKNKREKYDTAKFYLMKASELAKETGSNEYLKNAYFGLSELEKENYNYKDAYAYYILYSQTKDSLFNEEKSKEIGKLEAKHEYELAEVKRKQQEEERRRKEVAVIGRRNMLQYSGIFIFIVFVFSGILFSGKLHIPVRIAEGLIFFVFLLLFEFLLVWMDPYIESITGGEPLYKLIINAMVAAVIFPLHSFFERMLKKRISKSKKVEMEGLSS